MISNADILLWLLLLLLGLVIMSERKLKFLLLVFWLNLYPMKTYGKRNLKESKVLHLIKCKRDQMLLLKKILSQRNNSLKQVMYNFLKVQAQELSLLITLWQQMNLKLNFNKLTVFIFQETVQLLFLTEILIIQKKFNKY
jgi:hypothetical protein